MIKIIGGLGFVGSRLSSELFDCSTYDLKGKDGQWCDIRKAESLRGIINKNDFVILLAAEHRDDVTPNTKYYDTNLKGTQNVLEEMDRAGCKNLIFTSSVAVYGLNKVNPNENHPLDPFNHYGNSKLKAENAIKEWYDKDPTGKSVTVIRPTVIFGEKNRGNVYNLLRQIASKKFLMIGKGQNKKSMAYVGNVVAFIKFRVDNIEVGYNVFNYVDKPDLTMSSLIHVIEKSLQEKIPSIRIPIWLGFLVGYCFDCLSYLTNRRFKISSVRVKKFIATTQFDASKIHSTGFKSPYTLEEGLNNTLRYEFMQERSPEDDVFYTE